MDYDNYDAVLHYIWSRTQNDAWFKPSEENVSAGVCLRIEPGHFRVFPYENQYLVPFESAVRGLNPLVAVKVRSAAVHAALASVAEDAPAVYVDSETRIQILPSMQYLPQAEKEQQGAFLRDEHVLIVWSDDIDSIIPLCSEFEQKLMKLVWRNRHLTIGTPSVTTASGVNSTTGSYDNLNEKPAPAQTRDASAKVTDAAAAIALAEKEKMAPRTKWNFGWKLSAKKEEAKASEDSDAEKGATPKPRPIRYFAPIYGGLGMGLSIFFIGSGISVIVQETRLDNDYTRYAMIATAPFLLCISLFFSLSVVSALTYLFGPVAQYHENSRYYSAIAPIPNPEVDRALPHVTIEMPVYKESLEETIAPSVFSLKKAMQTYARQGGTSAIFVHDDGMQTLSPEEREKRVTFYANHNIGWVARPPHNHEGFVRAGRFKKASNMNYGLNLSLRMEKKILLLEREGFSEDHGISLEDQALEMAVEEIYQENGEKWRPWASNGKSLRIGENILIIDSDTIVPEDCFRDAARELHECPDVAVIQHESDVMQVAHHFFENGITHFTRRINKCISMAVANGEVAPFVGHNAFLRWSAIQDAAFVDPADGVTKCWSEHNVSEDFDIALRLQLKGYTIRWATYSDGGFKEGVSLTADDELNRWQKYAYGCNELMFNPLIRWWRVGPINKQLHSFMWSKAPVHYKISMMAYMFSYYGIAASAFLSLLNYLLLGWGENTDGFYMHSFEIWLACIVVFPGAGTVGYTVLEYRLGRRSLLESFIETITWVPFFFFFFGGISLHLSTALLAHLFSYNITWGATVKEVERSNFFLEVPRIWSRFKYIFILCITAVVGTIVLSQSIIPEDWRITFAGWAVILPLLVVAIGHILYPIVLNPWLIMFSY